VSATSDGFLTAVRVPYSRWSRAVHKIATVFPNAGVDAAAHASLLDDIQLCDRICPVGCFPDSVGPAANSFVAGFGQIWHRSMVLPAAGAGWQSELGLARWNAGI